MDQAEFVAIYMTKKTLICPSNATHFINEKPILVNPVITFNFFTRLNGISNGLEMVKKKTTVHPIGKQWGYTYETKGFGIAAKQIRKYWYQYESLLLGGIR